MSGYPTIWLSEPNPTILRASESDFLESNTIWPIPYPTFSKFGAKFGKKGVIFDEIFDFLGIRIRLFEILNYPNQSESDFLISDDIWFVSNFWVSAHWLVVAYFAVVIFERSGGSFLSKNNIDIPGSKFSSRNYEHITKLCTANSAHLSFWENYLCYNVSINLTFDLI